jgi:probable HAF family extracellular repeat protein
MGLFQGTTLAPVSINNQGQATGTYTTTVDRGFLWQDGVTIDLGELPGFPAAHGNSINDKGQIAGQTCSPVACTAFLWRDGVMTDLNTVVPAGSLYMYDPAIINSSGEIVGSGIDFATGQAHGFLAIPCDGTHANQESCNGKSATATPSDPGQGSIVALPESVRRLLRGRMGARFHVPGGF